MAEPRLKSRRAATKSDAETGEVLNLLPELCVECEQGNAVKRISSAVVPTLTVRDLAEYLRVHPSTVYRLLREGKLPAFRVGSDWRFSLEEIDHWRLQREKKSEV